MFNTEKLEPAQQAVEALKKLSIDDQLAALASIYGEVASSVSADTLGTPSSQVSGLVLQIEQKPQDRQVDALRDLLTSGKNDQGEVALDPNPSKALTELVTGGGETIPTGEYNALDTQSKLLFWYQIAQKLGSTIVGIPSNFSPSSEVTELLSTLKSLDDEKRMSFLKKVV